MFLSFHCFVTFITQGGLFSEMVQSRYCLQGQIDMSGLGTKNLLLVLLSSGNSEPHKLLTSKEHWVSAPPPDMIAAPVTCPFSSYLLPQGLNYFSEFRRFWKAASHLLWIDGKGGRMIDSSTEDACVGKAFDRSA